MVHAVGLMGANGLVGSATAKALAQLSGDGKIKLVILHREGKPPKDLGSGSNIELRVIDLDGPASATEDVVRGINVFISAVGIGALPSEPNLVDALAKSPDLVTYIPSSYSTPWTKEDKADPALVPFFRHIQPGWDRAKEKGIAMAMVYTGVFDIYFFEHGFVGAFVKRNVVSANKKQLQNRIPITVMDHLGQCIARVATSDPQSIKNTNHSCVTFWPTGQEVAELYTKINGKPAQINDFSSKDREDLRADAANFGAVKAGYRDHWESGQWDYETGGKIYDNNYQGPGIEEVARRFA